jgi:hypothetical protein
VQVSCVSVILCVLSTNGWSSSHIRSIFAFMRCLDLLRRFLLQKDASGKPVSLVTNDNPVWQAIRCVLRRDLCTAVHLQSSFVKPMFELICICGAGERRAPRRRRSRC